MVHEILQLVPLRTRTGAVSSFWFRADSGAALYFIFMCPLFLLMHFFYVLRKSVLHDPADNQGQCVWRLHRVRPFLGPYVREQVGGVNAADIVIIVFLCIQILRGVMRRIYLHIRT